MTLDPMPGYLWFHVVTNGGALLEVDRRDAGLGGVPATRIIAADALAERYRAAAAELGFEAEIVDPDCVAAGHIRIARTAGLVAGGAA